MVVIQTSLTRRYGLGGCPSKSHISYISMAVVCILFMPPLTFFTGYSHRVPGGVLISGQYPHPIPFLSDLMFIGTLQGMFYAARNVICCIKPLPCAWSQRLPEVVIAITKPAVGSSYQHTKSIFYETKFSRGGTPTQDRSTAFRCSVNFTAAEKASCLQCRNAQVLNRCRHL